MKYGIGTKFLAVLLCTVTLLSSILCLVGIAVLESADLYMEDFGTYYQEYYDSINLQTAKELARKQLSRQYGDCDEALIQALETYSYLNDNFRQGSVFYTIRDLGGEVLFTDYNGVTQVESIEVRVTSGAYYQQVSVKASDLENQYDGNNVAAITDPTTDGSDPQTPDTQILHVYAEKLGVYFAYEYRRLEMPTVIVTLHLTENARLNTELYEWALLLWQNRYNLFLVLAISLLLFAVGAVYLCWAAGRKPGSDEVKAGGFNALPLDLYTLLCSFCLFLAYEITGEIGYWFHASQVVFFVFFLFLGLFCCLLFVAWCFAWAAQIKEGGGRWWRKSILGWSLLTALELGNAVVTRWIPSLFRWFLGLLRLAGEVVKTIWTTFVNAVNWVWVKITGAFWWLGAKVERAFSLLPLTWQWLFIGFTLVLMLYLCLRTYKTGWLLMGFGMFFAMILYGAHAFGTLMEATRRMSKGDLDTKVEPGFLLGAFRNFADDLNTLADTVKLAAQKEMRSERMKTELITNVSHDIKTPLTSIINYVDLLQKPHTPEEEREYLEVLGRKSEQLKKLIQDLMEMSKASTGNMAVDIQPLNAGEAVNQALGEFAHKLEANQLTPVVTMPDAPVTILADGRLVWRVLSNLLNNAVTYALPGTRLYVGITRTGDQVRISLKNVSAEPLNIAAEELMERFVRGDASRNTDGSGLGLNIARSLMEVQRGRLTLEVDGDLFKATLIFPAPWEKL